MAYYKINENENFDKNNVSAAINDVISMMEDGDTAVLDYGDYAVKETINIGTISRVLQHCSISLFGNYKHSSVEPAISIRSNFLDFKFGSLYTGIRSDHYKVNTLEVLPGGIEILESNYSNISIDEVEGCEYGLKLCPNMDDTGICYTKFTFKYISYCYFPLYFAVDDNAIGWINENQFFGGRLKGYYGLKATKGIKQIDECNNNTFYNIAFESIETNGIDLQFCTFNTTISPRFESVMGYAIKETENCKSNKYIISVALPLDSISIESKYTNIEAPLHTYWEHVISRYMTDSEGRKSYEFFREITVTVSEDETDIPMNCKNIIIPDDIYSPKILLNQYSEFENNRIMVYNYYHNAEITILKSDMKAVAESVPLSVGKYELVFFENGWSFLGNNLEHDEIKLKKAVG